MQQAIFAGTVINNRYQIQKQIPDTTSNQSYLAEDTEQSNRLVVISFPKIELQTLPSFISSYEDACQRLIKTRLNGLVKVLDHGVFEAQPYAVLQYVSHETLKSTLAAKKLRQKKLTVEEVLDWARPLAVTLDELHSAGYIHSNVSPANIFIGQNRQILLGGFITEFTVQHLGASKQAIAALDVGNYLAPEYIKSNYTESYDQYLLATLIYEALAARSHFHNPGSTEAYRRQVATKFPEPLLNHRPELVGASKVLGKALERNPLKRFDSCREFVNQLESGQVNPTFDGYKPVTVIKKVLEFDETAPVEPIITSIRARRNRSRRKGLIWLGIILLGVGASSYAINEFGGVSQLKGKIVTAWNDISQPKSEAPVVIPVDLNTVELQQTASVSAPTPAPTPTVAELPIPVDTNSVSTNQETSINTVSEVVDDQKEALVKSEEKRLSNDVVASDSNQELPGDSLSAVVDEALKAGQDNFLSLDSPVSPTFNADVVSAVSTALKDAQEDYSSLTRSADESSSTTDISVLPAANKVEIEGEAVVETEIPFGENPQDEPKEDTQVAVTEQTEESLAAEKTLDAETVENAKLSKAELDAIALNEQMYEANKLADEQAAAARLKAKQKRQNAQSNQSDVTEAPAAIVEENTRSTKTFDEMQQERERLLALKAEKTAKINSITKDCTDKDKIHRQVAEGNLAYVKNCLAVGVDPNLAQNNKWSLLHLAAWGGHLNMAKLLVAKGADVNATAVDGKTPLDLAGEKKQDRLITYLKSRGGVATR